MKSGIVLLVAVAVACLQGCTIVPMVEAPGTADLKVTHEASDVASCTSVGNVDGRPYEVVDRTNGLKQMRNEVVGLGGDTLLVTSAVNTGIAYRCGKGAPAGK